MVIIIFIWLLSLFIFISSGTAVISLIRTMDKNNVNTVIGIDRAFFAGFLVISVILGYLSILIPVNTTLFIIICLISIGLFVLNFNLIKASITEFLKEIFSLRKYEKMLISFFLLFVLLSVVQPITWGDSQAYHAQNIQWIRKYPVLPGLANLHDGFGFNSMFFVTSAAFTFKFKDILIFPLNSVCYVVVTIKLLMYFFKNFRQGTIWKSLFYTFLVLISFLFMIPNLNTPSADIICSSLLIYVFAEIFNSINGKTIELEDFLILGTLIIQCITFKLSSLPVIVALLLIFNKDVPVRLLLSALLGVIFVIPFLIRNYYLSGYLIYPFPAIDLFNVDWKVPSGTALEAKSIIEAWARIPVVPYPEVIALNFSAWTKQWFSLMSFNNKLLVISNLFLIITFIVTIIKKQYLLTGIHLVLLLNLVFWFLIAPDTRFAYGILFTGSALAISCIVRVIENAGLIKILPKLAATGLISLTVVIAGRRAGPPIETIMDPVHWALPAEFGPVETVAETKNGFTYNRPVTATECFYSDIPCVVYPKDDLVLRGDNIRDGFRIQTMKK